jgi:catechol 2,3-dioxygenase-like lactoylglutathione lyase family enzyme
LKIKELKLYSHHLKEQKEFYVSLFGLELVNDSSDSFTVKVGDTLLSFIKCEDNPYYHFAINIPSNHIEESANWLKERTAILPFENEEIVNFTGWNARSIYFYDADKNIVEFIARGNLNINSSDSFSAKSLLSLSEIGIPTSNVPEIFTKLNEEYALGKYDCDLKKFCAVGDENGLFIVVNYNLKKWLPAMDEALPFPFEIHFDNNKGKIYNLRVDKENTIHSFEP